MTLQLSRRDLLRFRIGAARRRANAEHNTGSLVRGLDGFLRPPGARVESELTGLCNGCGACVNACPERAISLLSNEYGHATGTPVIEPTSSPCRACTDTPCITACDRGALSIVPSERVPAQTIHFADEHCWAAQGQPCDYCVSACPIDPPALRLHRASGKTNVQIDALACCGCGLCIFYCTATPRALSSVHG